MKTFKIIFLFVLATFTTFSCSDAYEIDPKDELPDPVAIKTIEDLEKAMVGVYASIGGSGIIEWTSYFTDELRMPSSNRGSGVQVHTWSINNGSNEPEGLYFSFFSTINRANTLLSKLDGVSANNTDEENIKKRIEAECRAIRAHSHFELLRLFATSYTDNDALGITIVDRVLVNEKLPRNTVGEVVEFITTELAEAKAILDEVGTPSNDVNKIRVPAIQAMRARVALYTANYDDAITFSTDVIAAHPLSANPTQYGDIWGDGFSPEVVFKLTRVPTDGRIGSIYTDLNGDVLWNVSYDLFDQFTAGDIRLSSLYAPGSTLDNIKVGKYIGQAGAINRADIKLFRSAEMYLIRSEAHALKSTPDLTAATSDLNALRANRNVALAPLFSNSPEAINTILLERRKELCFEGHRYFDLKRHNRPIERIADDTELQPEYTFLPAGDYRFTLPIPFAAIFANSSLQGQQNEGY